MTMVDTIVNSVQMMLSAMDNVATVNRLNVS